VIWDYENQKIRFAGFNYLVSTHVGLLVLVAAFMLLHARANSMDLLAFGAILSEHTPARGTLFLLLGVAFALKSAFFPFHTWLPRAHAAAPAHVSALMSGVIHKAGLFAFLRFTLLMGRPDEWMGWAVLTFGGVSAFLGALYTPAQRDLKRLLGYSSTENVGIAAMGFGLGYLGWSWDVPVLTACGFAGGLLHVFNHALFKCLLFYAAGAVYRGTHSVDLERLGGLAKRMPRTAVLFLTGSLAISGLPPLNGFVSEALIYSGLFSGSAPSAPSAIVLIAAAATLAFVGAVSALAATRAFGVVFLGNARDPSLPVGKDPPLRLLGPMLMHAVAVVVLGIMPELGFHLIRGSVALFAPAANIDQALLPLTPMLWATRALAAALVITTAVSGWRARRARRTVTWGCGYSATSPRMQYTGTSFADTLLTLFSSLLPVRRREELPSEIFPRRPGRLETHHPDAVEQRVFEVLRRAEARIVQLAARIPEQPKFAFAAGLCALLLIAVLSSAGDNPR
jgi:hydrogenase-4 component B